MTFTLLQVAALAFAACVVEAIFMHRRAKLWLREYMPISQVRTIMSLYQLNHRDLVHQHPWGPVDPQRASVANDMVGMLVRLDGAEMLRDRWVVREDAFIVEDFMRRAGDGVEMHGNDIERAIWDDFVRRPSPVQLSTLVTLMMCPELSRSGRVLKQRGST